MSIPGYSRVACALISVLLRYPTETLVAGLDVLDEACEILPAPAAEPLRRLIAHLDSTPLGELQAEYVSTFDFQRRNCLYLTYYHSGDTRRRGGDLLRFSEVYRFVGVSSGGGELPDFLPMVLELAATDCGETAFRLIDEYREAIDVLRVALDSAGSPYVDAIVALDSTLPASSNAVSRNIKVARELISQGPPGELVGLSCGPGLQGPPGELVGLSCGPGLQGPPGELVGIGSGPGLATCETSPIGSASTVRIEPSVRRRP